MTATLFSATASEPATSSPVAGTRVMSIDALRGLVMFTMIFVNDIAGVSKNNVPWWMRHFKENGNGMTFVDLVFPAFLFIVGMSIPFALGPRLDKGEAMWKTLLHVGIRALSLLFIGVVMVNESPDSKRMGWSATLWTVLMFLAAILAFCSISPRHRSETVPSRKRIFNRISTSFRVLGHGALVFLAFAFRGVDGHRIISLAPFSIHTEWYGILGLIGWAYLVAAIVFLLFRGHRTALLGCAVLLMCLYPADRKGAFDHFWLAHYVSIGETLGSQAAITVAGILLASILVRPLETPAGAGRREPDRGVLTPHAASVSARARFTLLFVAGCSGAALLLHRLYGINKNNATPSWCLWACAITAALWLSFYFLCDVHPQPWLAKPLSVAGQNVLLAYLLSEMLPATLELLRIDDWYGSLAEHGLASALLRSAGCAAVILWATAALNRLGFRLKL